MSVVNYFSVTLAAMAVAMAVVIGIGPVAGTVMLGLLIAVWLSYSRPTIAVAAYAAIITANVADVATDVHGLPPIGGLLVPALAALLIARALAGAEDLSGAARLAIPAGFYLIGRALALFQVQDLALTLADLVDLTKNLLILMVFVGFVTSMHRLRAVARAIALSAAAMGALAIFQYATKTFDNNYLGFANASMKQIVGATDSWRVSGPLPDPNFFGQVLVMALPLTAGMVAGERNPVLRLLGLLGAVLVFAAIFLTFSRGAVMGVAAMVIFSTLALKSRWIILSGVAVLATVSILLAPAEYFDRLTPVFQATTALVEGQQSVNDPALAQRIAVVTAATEMFRMHPVLGVGIGQYPETFGRYALLNGLDIGAPPEAHSMFLETAAEGGLLGLGLLLGVIVAAFFCGRRALARAEAIRNTQDAALIRSLQLSFVGYLTTAIFLHGAYARFFWLLAALLLASVSAIRTPTGQKIAQGKSAPRPLMEPFHES